MHMLYQERQNSLENKGNRPTGCFAGKKKEKVKKGEVRYV